MTVDRINSEKNNYNYPVSSGAAGKPEKESKLYKNGEFDIEAVCRRVRGNTLYDAPNCIKSIAVNSNLSPQNLQDIATKYKNEGPKQKTTHAAIAQACTQTRSEEQRSSIDSTRNQTEIFQLETTIKTYENCQNTSYKTFAELKKDIADFKKFTLQNYDKLDVTQKNVANLKLEIFALELYRFGGTPEAQKKARITNKDYSRSQKDISLMQQQCSKIDRDHLSKAFSELSDAIGKFRTTTFLDYDLMNNLTKKEALTELNLLKSSLNSLAGTPEKRKEAGINDQQFILLENEINSMENEISSSKPLNDSSPWSKKSALEKMAENFRASNQNVRAEQIESLIASTKFSNPDFPNLNDEVIKYRGLNDEIIKYRLSKDLDEAIAEYDSKGDKAGKVYSNAVEKLRSFERALHEIPESPKHREALGINEQQFLVLQSHLDSIKTDLRLDSIKMKAKALNFEQLAEDFREAGLEREAQMIEAYRKLNADS